MISDCVRSLLGGGLLAATLALPLDGNTSGIDYVTGDDIPALGPYVPATVLGDLVFTSGQVAFDAEAGEIVGTDIRTQTRRVLENLRAVLEAAGSSLEHTLRITVYLQDPEDAAAMSEVYAEFFPDHKPARTTVPGADWGGAVLVEIDAIAVRIEDDTD